jgi:pyroglutamyl-peptidase
LIIVNHDEKMYCQKIVLSGYTSPIVKRIFLCFILLAILFYFSSYAEASQLRILITGFEPFGGYRNNPSQQLVEYVNHKHNKDIPGTILRGVTLPVAYYACWDMLHKEIDAFHPDYILSFGYSPGNNRIALERLANNYDGGLADNNSMTHSGEIIKNGTAHYISTLPLVKISQSLTSKGLPVDISDNAGGYLCNHIFYQVLHFSSGNPGLRAGFIHIPDLPVFGENGSWAILKQIITVLIRNTIKVGVFEFEPIKDNVPGNINRVEDIMRATDELGIGFYVFPEMALSGLMYDSPADVVKNNHAYKDDSVTKTLQHMARCAKKFIAIGLITQSHGALYNSYQIYTPEGEIYTYHKQHLYGSDYYWATPGREYPIMSTHFGKVGALICHDVVYDDSFQEYLKQKVPFLIVGTNWIGTTPITHYLMKYRESNLTIFVSDRKGSENGIDFLGNTIVLDRYNTYQPNEICSGIRGIVYLFIAEATP